MKNNVAALTVGFLFALGLGISGMSRPDKVFGFLDLFGTWDASLVFVMIGAISIHFFGQKFILKRNAPLFSKKFFIPTSKEITRPLLVGAFIFGVGWGLSGYCPGPALTSIMSFQLRPLIFFLSMLVGMIFFRLYQNQINKQRS
ncbi:MAG: YeeE/YedE family protein [Bdellovibrionaceae bacterium]|nr:YeeE/YedE family protein [Pseudobdellovibrionaceae bacterium]